MDMSQALPTCQCSRPTLPQLASGIILTFHQGSEEISACSLAPLVGHPRPEFEPTTKISTQPPPTPRLPIHIAHVLRHISLATSNKALCLRNLEPSGEVWVFGGGPQGFAHVPSLREGGFSFFSFSCRQPGHVAFAISKCLRATRTMRLEAWTYCV